MLVRRFLLICGSSAVAVALVVGSFVLYAVIADLYPIVPSEGFSLGRKVEEVVTWTSMGALLGLGLGIIVFSLSLAWDGIGRRNRLR